MLNDLNKLTVPELRKMAKEFTDDSVSKLRKAELIDVIAKAKALTELDHQANAYITDGALQDFVGNALSAASGIGKLGGAIQAFGTVLHEQLEAFTAAEREELNEAKYRGRYEGKSVTVRVGRRTVHGTVVDRAHRDSDPLNAGNGKGLLLLAVRHDGRPRATLHRAEDVTVSV